MSVAEAIWVGIAIGFASTLVLEVAIILIAYRLSSEGREHAAIKRRMHDKGIKAKSQIYHQVYEETRDELKLEGKI